jgi:Mss4 protein
MADESKAPAVTEEGKNAQTAVCRACGTKVFLAGAATLVDAGVVLPGELLGAEEAVTFDKAFQVPSRFGFENVSVTRPTSKEAVSFRLLACGECDVGPIGIARGIPANGEEAAHEEYLVFPGRVAYI